jgi:ribose 5-phosphate isomerase RpiB
MKGQYEQQCNAAALRKMGIPVIKSLKKKHIPTIQKWLNEEQKVLVDYPDITEKIISNIIKEHGSKTSKTILNLGDGIPTLKKLKAKTFGKILTQLVE